MTFKLKSQGAAFKMMGSSPARKVGGDNEKKSIGPIKPMTDKDGDGIPVGVDIKDTPGGRQGTPPKESPDAKKRGGGKPNKNTSTPKEKTDSRKRPFDDGRNEGNVKGNTEFRSNMNKIKGGEGIELLNTNIKNKAKELYNYFTKK